MLKTFLPQYAAQCVFDLEWSSKRLIQNEPQLASVARTLAVLIRESVHVVLPPNGEVYRDTGPAADLTAPTPEECISIGNLPAPVTCFEYPWTHKIDLTHYPKDSELTISDASKRITIALDGRQLSNDRHGSDPSLITFFSLFYERSIKRWTFYPLTLTVSSPLEVASPPRRLSEGWGVMATSRDLETGKILSPTSALAIRCVAEFRADLVAVLQCCHSLRAGASLAEQTELSSMRRRKFEQKGVGGFSYHVLTLPQKIIGGQSTDGNNIHASPRFHVRRAHIRKLSTGSLAFVRQCFVGNPDDGMVSKHYNIKKVSGC